MLILVLSVIINSVFEITTVNADIDNNTNIMVKLASKLRLLYDISENDKISPDIIQESKEDAISYVENNIKVPWLDLFISELREIKDGRNIKILINRIHDRSIGYLIAKGDAFNDKKNRIETFLTWYLVLSFISILIFISVVISSVKSKIKSK